MWFTKLAISRPIIIWMALAALTVLGLQAYFRLPAELNPKVSIPTVTVTTVYAGAGPPEIEAQVSKVLEDAVGTVGGVKEVFSSSQANVSILSMDFQSGVDIDTAVSEVSRKIEAVRSQLPVTANSPVVSKLDINALPILYFGLESPSLKPQELRSLADKLVRPRLERVSGVASVQIVGGEEREILVSVDSQKLAEFGVTILDVVNSLKSSGRDIPGGGITEGGRETEVRLAGSYSSLAGIRETRILSQRLSPSSPTPSVDQLPIPQPVIADVATVAESKAEQKEINRINGVDGVSLVLTKSYDANTVAVVDGVNKALEELKPAFPSDLKRVNLTDSSETVREALSDVNMSLVIGAFLAMIVILFFLHNFRGTLIVSLAIPACVVSTFLVMQAANFSLNQMTLLALSLSVGILVDDSIVILESITRHLNEGKDPKEAALIGRKEIGFADMTTTLVDVVVFVPIAFMGGVVGGFFKQFGLTIAFATLFSLVVSFSITPMLASRWYKKGESLVATKGFFAPFERFYRSLEERYRALIDWALSHRFLVVGVGVGALATIFALSFNRLGFEFMPGSDQGQIVVNLEMPPGSSLLGTSEAARALEKRVALLPDVEATVTNVGRILGAFGSIPQAGNQFAQINIRLKDKIGLLDGLTHPVESLQHKRSRSDDSIAKELRRLLADITRESGGVINVLAVRSVIGSSLPVSIQLKGKDTLKLAEVAEKIRERMKLVPGVLDPDVSARSGKPEVRVRADPERSAEFGIGAGMAGLILHDSVTGNTESVFRKSGQEFPIRIQMAGIQGDNPDLIKEIGVGYDRQGSLVTLGDISTILPKTGPTNIDRDNGEKLVTLSSNLSPGTPLGNVRKLIQKEIDAVPHSGVSVHWSGEAETLDDNAPLFASALILAIILVYLVMAALFNNLGTPLVIMFTCPMALIGALGALVLLNETLSLVSCIGVLMLVGLMTRNAILLLDYANTLTARGKTRRDALIEAGATRLRPILMTTTATIVGMLPVAMRIGRASEVRAPMAIVVIGGLLVSTILTLVMIPVLFSLYDDLTKRFQKKEEWKEKQIEQRNESL